MSKSQVGKFFLLGCFALGVAIALDFVGKTTGLATIQVLAFINFAVGMFLVVALPIIWALDKERKDNIKATRQRIRYKGKSEDELRREWWGSDPDMESKVSRLSLKRNAYYEAVGKDVLYIDVRKEVADEMYQEWLRSTYGAEMEA